MLPLRFLPAVLATVLLASILPADDTPTLSSFLSKLDNDRLLKIAKLCRTIYKLPEQTNNGELTKQLMNLELIGLSDKVVMQGFRHGDQLGTVLVKSGVKSNHFVLVFSGTESANDWLSDANAISTKEDAKNHLESMLKGIVPNVMHIRNKKHQRETTGHEINTHKVDVHLGFKRANKDFLKKLFADIRQYVRKNHPVTFELYGHSMGGALAAHAAYRICKDLPDILGIPNEWIAVDVVTFASAGVFDKDDLSTADKVIRASNSMVNFVRKHDFARELTDRLGFANPGHYILLDNFVQIEGDLDSYFERIKSLEETPLEIFERIQQEAKNHSIRNYIETIEAGIKCLLAKELRKAEDQENKPEGNTISDEIVKDHS